MDIATKTLTTKITTASLSADEVSGVLAAVAKKQAGVASDLLSKVNLAADGSATVQITEETAADGAEPKAVAPADAQPAAAAPTPPAFHFPKAA